MEIPDDPPGGDSDSSDEEDEGEVEAGTVDSDAEATTSINDEISDDEGSLTHSEQGNHPQLAHEIGFPNLPSEASAQRRRCLSCASTNLAEIEDDDGVSVTNTKRKQWEKWVVHRRKHS